MRVWGGGGHTVGGHVHVRTLRKIVWRPLENQKEHNYDPDVLLGMHPKELNQYVEETPVPIFISALFTKAKV